MKLKEALKRAVEVGREAGFTEAEIRSMILKWVDEAIELTR